MHFVRIQVLKEIALLSLVIGDIESIPGHIVLLLSVEVFNHWQGVVIGALLHCSRICHLTATKTTLVLDLAW